MIKRKIIYITALIGVIFINAFYVDYQFFFLLLLMIIMPLLSWLIFTFAKFGLKIFLEAPENVIVKESENILKINTVNACPMLLANGRLKLFTEYSQTDYSEENVINVNVFQEEFESYMEYTPKYCGIMTVKVGSLDLYDYLYLFHSVRRFSGSKTIVVLPKLLYPKNALSQGTQSTSTKLENINLYLNGSSDEIADLRQFKDGDSYKHIHWKLSANNPDDDYIVKHFEEMKQKVNTIIIDTGFTEEVKFREDLDKIYQMAYSIGYYYTMQKEQAAFLVWDESIRDISGFVFSNEEELRLAMIGVMKTGCTRDAIHKVCMKTRELVDLDCERPLVITATDYKDYNYKIINVLSDSIDEAIG